MSELGKPDDSNNNEFGISSDKECIGLLQLLVNQTSDGILITKIDTLKIKEIEVIYANQSFYKMTGFTKEEMLGNPLFSFLDPIDNGEVITELKDAFVSPENYKKELILNRKNREPYWVQLSIITYPSDIKNQFYRIHNYRELTYEVLLKESQQKYKSLFDNHPHGIFSLDLKGNFTSANDACAKMTRYSKNELLNMPLNSIILERNSEEVRKAFEDALNGVTKTIEVAIKNKNDRIKNGTITNIPIYINNQVEGVFVIVQDISHGKHLNRILNIEKKVLEHTIAGEDVKQTLNLFLSEIEDLYPSLNVTIMLANSKRAHLDFYAGQSLPPSFAKSLKNIPIEIGAGACGTTAYLKKPTIVADVFKSQLMQDYWELAKVYDVKACWSYPIVSSKGAILGTFAIYRNKNGYPDKKFDSIMERAGNILSILIENKQNELAYKQLNERFKLAMDASNEAIWDWDIKNDSLMWGSGFEIIFGYPLEKTAVNFLWWSTNIHPDDKERIIDSLHDALASKASYWSSEYRYKSASGEYRFVLDRGSIIRDSKYKAVRMVGAMMDLTERKIAEETILESEEQFRSLADSTMEGIAISRNGEIIDYNKAFSILVGYDHNSDKLIGKSLLDFINEEDLETAKECIESGKTQFFEVDGLKKKGATFPVEIRAVNSIYKGKPAQTISFRNILERKKNEEKLLDYASELSRSNAELEQFAYMASHDLQEPLRMVTSFLQLLKGKYEGKLDDSADQYIAYAIDGAERMKILIRDLLKFSKISFQEEETETIDLNELLLEVKKVFSDKLQEENGTLEIMDLPVIEGQKALFSQLFQNIIGNGLKYRRKVPPVIKISVKENKNHWEFIVADNGIGIEEKFHEKIFVVFQRLHTRDEFQGTGIGLAICKKIVEKYGGEIWLNSIPGKGSEFHFTIPKKFNAKVEAS